jgi:hypothetical protein
MQKQLKRDIGKNKFGKGNKFKMQDYFQSKTITTGLRTALATGNWGKDKDNNVLKTGVS